MVPVVATMMVTIMIMPAAPSSNVTAGTELMTSYMLNCMLTDMVNQVVEQLGAATLSSAPSAESMSAEKGENKNFAAAVAVKGLTGIARR